MCEDKTPEMSEVMYSITWQDRRERPLDAREGLASRSLSDRWMTTTGGLPEHIAKPETAIRMADEKALEFLGQQEYARYHDRGWRTGPSQWTDELANATAHLQQYGTIGRELMGRGPLVYLEIIITAGPVIRD